MANQYDVQILKGGEWSWAGVEPMPTTRQEARRIAKKLIQDTAWCAWVGVEKVRVQQTGFTTKGLPKP